MLYQRQRKRDKESTTTSTDVPIEYGAKGGISILIKKKYKKFITNFDTIYELIIKIHLTVFGERITVIGIYAPNEDETKLAKNISHEKLQQLLDEVEDTRKVIIVSDFNGRTGEEHINENGERLVELYNKNKLKIMNGFLRHKNIHKYTWTQSMRQLKSIIDYVIMRQTAQLQVQDVRALRGLDCG